MYVLVFQQGNFAAVTLDYDLDAQVTKCGNKETNNCLVAQEFHLRVTLLVAIKRCLDSCGDRFSNKNCCNQDRCTLENLLDEKTC